MPQGLNCTRSIPPQARDIVTSQIGRVDVNAVSHGGSTGITGMLTPTCEIDKLGFFSKDSADPDGFNNTIKAVKKNLKDKNIEAKKEEINEQKAMSRMNVERRKFAKTLVKDGHYVIGKRITLLKNEADERTVISGRKSTVRTYLNKDGFRMTENGKFLIKRRYKPVFDKNNKVHISPHLVKIHKTGDGRSIIKMRHTKPPIRDGKYLIKSRKGNA